MSAFPPLLGAKRTSPAIARLRDGVRRGLSMSRKSNRRTSGMQIELPDALEKIQPWPHSLGCPLDDSGTRRIVEAVGARFVPQGLKLEALRDDLRGCYIRWGSLTQLSSDKEARQRFERFHAIAKHAERLLTLL